jgi:hypothetical protein
MENGIHFYPIDGLLSLVQQPERIRSRADLEQRWMGIDTARETGVPTHPAASQESQALEV